MADAGTSTSGAIPTSTTGLAANDDLKVVAGGDRGGNAGATVPVNNVPKVGKRPKNPLGDFSSYTYHLTLYMVSPDAYNEFVATGRKNINAKTPGAYIIAQSGGTPASNPTKRADGFELDFYIDNLRIETKLPAATPTTTELSFNIIEPYGFSFITKLNQALDKVLTETTLPGYNKPNNMPNATRQLFVLSVGFRGYDLNGKVMTNADMGKTKSLSAGASGEIFDHYYDIIVTSMKFKLDGKETKYDIKAATIAPNAAFSLKLGTVPVDTRVTAGNVADALGGLDADPAGVAGLLTMMNKTEDLLVKPPVDGKNPESAASQSKKAFANKYKVRWEGDEGDTESISGLKKASLVSIADSGKSKSPMADVKTSGDSTEAAAKSATIDSTKKTITIKAGTPMIQAVDDIIKQSSWVEDTLKVIQASKIEVDDESENSVTSGGSKELKWYNLSADVKILGWNDLQSDFAYEITYVIRPYSIPAVGTPFIKKQGVYYGAYKRYDYWLTGKNSEVIKVEQQFDNAYLNTMYMGTSSNDGTGVTNLPNMPTNEVQQGRLGEGFATHNATVAFLKDPAAYTKTKIQILGDPDYLIPDTKLGSGYYVADGFTINPASNQVFIEIAYKEAKDYKNSTGTLLVNGNVQFWPYSAKVKKLLNGAMCYLLIGVTSTFNRGTFIQDLSTAVNIFPNYGAPTATRPTESIDSRGATNSEGTTGETAAKANMTGTMQTNSLPTNVDALVKEVSQRTVPSSNGQVADDDAKLSQTDKRSGE